MKLRAWIVLALISGSAAFAAELPVKVVGISDGDTVTVLDASKTQHKIRLGGIDAPEKKQAYGNKSKEALSDCAFGKQVVVEWDKVDRYGRKVGKVISGTTDCNLRQIQLGLAWHYKKYAREQSAQDRATYDKEEALARRDKRGLWVDANAVAPWEFRAAR